MRAGEPALSRQLCRSGDAAPIAGRRSKNMHPRDGEMRQGIWLRRHQPQPGPIGRALDFAAAFGPAVVSDLREDGRAQYPGHDPRLDKLQSLLSYDRRALPQCRHDRIHAVPDFRSVQGLSNTEVLDPAWRRRGTLSLGTFSRLGAGDEKTAPEGAPSAQHLFRYLRLSPAGDRFADQGDPGREHLVRERDDWRGSRDRS